ncbi:MAG: head GIN domain-containing protein [Gelidibacter sp.]
MKKVGYILICVLFFACNGENVPDCFQNAGNLIQKDFEVETFTKVTVFERVQLIITDAPTQKVTVQTGEYLMNDIDVKVEDGRLILKNNNACNLTRNYGITKVFVSAPNLVEIRNSSGLEVQSNGVLNYNSLTLYSEDFNAENAFHTDGDFNLEVNCETLKTVINNISHLFLKGNVTNLTIGFYAGDSRFEGANLIAQNITIFQRSSNDMIVNPQLSLKGEIRSTGDVISLNHPPVVDVQTYYTGQLIFQ